MSSAKDRGPRPHQSKPCPICGKPSTYESRPFCSDRCQKVDLHRWLGGQYAIPVVEEDGGIDPDTDERG